LNLFTFQGGGGPEIPLETLDLADPRWGGG